MVGRNIAVGIATRCKLDVLGIESQLGGRIFPAVHTGTGAHSAACKMCNGSVSWG